MDAVTSTAGRRFLGLIPARDRAASSRQVVSIQYLRAVAATMVMVFHLGGQLGRLGYAGPWPEWMARGVDIFFVISGFVMWLTARSRRTGTAVFYWNRLVRIVPLYWVLTSFIVAMMLLLPSLVQSGQFDLYHTAMSYLFLPAPQPHTGLVFPVLEPGWTLNYEMYFYAVFGALLFLPDRPLLIVLAVWQVGSVAVAALMPGPNLFVQFYGSSMVLDFGFGVGLAVAFMHDRVLPAALAWVLIPAGFLQLSLAGFIDAPHWVANGLPALAIVAGAVALERRYGMRRLWPLLLVGDASYSLYLSHGIVLSACLQVTRKLGLGAVPGILPLFFVGACLASILVALLIHAWVENPLLTHLSSRRRTALASVPSATPG